MISVYDRNETDFFHNGIVLTEAIHCTIEEELNGKYVLELIHPIDEQGKWEYLAEENIIKADGQLFRIYATEKTLDRIYVYARHIFYDLLHNFLEDVRPTNLNGAAALDWILSHTLYPHPFTGTSDIDTINTRYFIRVNPVEAILGEDGLVERWGGELLRDNFTIKLLKQRGQNKGAKIAYGKNLLGLEVKRDMDTVVTRIMPVGRDELLLPERYVDSPLIDNYVYPRVRVVQFDIGVDEETTEEEAYEKLRQACRELYEKNKIDIPAVNITVNLLLLENTEEYKNLKQLEKVELGDIVSCTDNPLKITFEAKVIRVKKDVIANRNVEVELGQYKKGISNTIRDVLKNISEEIKNTSSSLEESIEKATKLLTNALGGHVLKRPGELLIMDTDDPATAQKVWRWNLNGLGYSDNGINGPYRLAITMDGQIVADFITTGTLDANLIKTGTLRGRKVEWNLDDGTLLIGNNKEDYNLYFDGNNLSIKLSSNKSIETALTELETGLQDYADQAANQAIDNIQVGGRNLIPNSHISEVFTLDPQTATFTRSSVAYLSDGTQVAANEPRFEQGKFGKAVLVEEGTTNRIINALLVDSNSDGLADNWGQGNTTNHSCLNGVQTFTATARFGAVVQNFNFGSATGPWAFSVEIKGLDGYLVVYLFDANGNYLGNATSVRVNNDQTFTRVTCATTRTDVRNVQFRIEDFRSSGWTPISFRKPQIEVGKAYATSFTDSTRSPETLTIPTAGVFNKGDWTLELWYKAKKIGSIPRTLVELWIDDDNKYAIELDSRYKLTGGIKYNGIWTLLTDSSIVTDDIWYYIAFTGNGNTIKFYVNGELKGSSVYSEPVGNLPSYIYLGSNPSGANQPNSLIDDLRISNRARTDEEIAAAYASGQPLPVDQYTTYKMGFDDTLQPTGKHERLVNLEAGQKYTFSAQTSGNVQCSIYEPTLTHPGLSIPAADMPVQFIPDWTGEYKVAFSANESCSLKAKLEKGNKATDWTPAPEDLAESINNKADAEDVDNLSTIVSAHDSIIEQHSNEISMKVDNSVVDEMRGIIDQQSSSISQLAENVTIEFTTLNNDIEDINNSVQQIKTGIVFDENGMTIGKSDSPFQMTLSNEQLEFLENSQVVAYINGQKMYVTMAEILESLVVGKHKIEKYDENITLIRWVG